ncbi:hypothetical protein IJ00_12950 [Calothrix sp. 336/3]|uniref:hypothetical protein n=2 Tax=Calothrix sp. 336/3 TaxID=1337936 RepID=UPI0004E357D9|nr:hypothetical protein [Calothrix sp. 336/3]AKG22043.1 hypothetical protein IJ00_12950 [Calothrix sp. 336/3]
MSEMSREDVRERLGNIDQIRDIIFGAHLREYENRFSKLESNVGLLQQEVRSQLEQLKTSFTIELKTALEGNDKKLKLLSLSTQEETADLRQLLDRLNRRFSSSLQSLDESLDNQTKSIRDELNHGKAQLQDDITALRDLVLEELERHCSQLQNTKVSRADMAETLFALGMRLKGEEFIPQLQKAVDANEEDYSQLNLLESTQLSRLLTHSHSLDS